MANLPSFYTDQYYTGAQETLDPLGKNILAGEIPDYYSGIGKSNSEEFQNMLAMINRDVKTGVTESNARMGVRGGRGGEAVAKAVGDVGTKMRYSDYLRSLEGKEFLFGQGRGITEGVRSAGLSYGGQQNQFNLNTAQMEMQQEQYEDQMKQEEDKAWMEMLSAGIGAAGNIAGMAFMGGFPLGSAATSIGSAGGALSSGNQANNMSYLGF